jgi:DNA-binding CsgD family transcriptional regulator|tara:strand:+ start:264 stop:782 length:519 start_codon:yes stop_codon:yes gene_type:complete
MITEFRKNRRFVVWVFGGTIICFVFFAFDVAIDLREHLIEGVGYSGSQLTHLFFEMASVLTLGGCTFVTFDYLEDLRKSELSAKTSLHALRHDFDDLLQKRFKQWAFSSAERDVALFMLRGLSILEIAELRETRPGTVKVQAHNIFKKSGVGSRAEFTSLFMEEFIDVGVTT